MNNTFRLRILAADKVFYEGNCTSLTIPTPGGELGILANHSNMIAAVVPASCAVSSPTARRRRRRYPEVL